MSSSYSYYRGKNEAKQGVNNTPKLVYIPMECHCGMRTEIKIVEWRHVFDSNWCIEGQNPPNVGSKAIWDKDARECFILVCVEELGGANYKSGTQLTKVGWTNVVTKFNERMGKDWKKEQLKNQWGVLKKEWQLWQNLVLGESGLGRDPDTGPMTASDEWWELKLMLKPSELEEEMRILFESNTAIGEGSYAPNSGVMARTREGPLVVDVDNIDELLDDDATQELVHPTKVQKQVAVDGSATKKAKGKKGTVTSRLEACMQQRCDSSDSASSPFVQRAVAEIPIMKECTNKLSELREFNEDAEFWAQGFNLFKDSKIRAMFMSCLNNLRIYHFITQELNRTRTFELAKTWFASTL
ncbi:hypothetical protein RHMOL_Rhmol11G0123400 [Rhododendron molle]|uniref:Uncharacterized protein n=1 Tax=Rhododendron molle TaxID=49168 RepID=A0ACC0LRI2_RHOML|nr:hypothetical protein RHMOL_Rhmol11G0123400 [Rhododendron molle]